MKFSPLFNDTYSMEAKFNSGHITRVELPRIRSALTATEKGLDFAKMRLKDKEQDIWAHPTSAPNGGWYLPTDIHALN